MTARTGEAVASRSGYAWSSRHALVPLSSDFMVGRDYNSVHFIVSTRLLFFCLRAVLGGWISSAFSQVIVPHFVWKFWNRRVKEELASCASDCAAD